MGFANWGEPERAHTGESAVKWTKLRYKADILHVLEGSERGEKGEQLWFVHSFALVASIDTDPNSACVHYHKIHYSLIRNTKSS